MCLRAARLGRGFAQEAAAAVLKLAREVKGIPKLAAITSAQNNVSMAVLREIGFTYQGMIQLPGMERKSSLFYHQVGCGIKIKIEIEGAQQRAAS